MREQTLREARLLIGQCVAKLMNQDDLWQIDLVACSELIKIAKSLRHEESAQRQLDAADKELGWVGTSWGRIDMIRALKDPSRLDRDAAF